MKTLSPKQVAAEIVRRKKQFAILSLAGKRVAIARDVLEQIRKEVIVPNTGRWIGGVCSKDDSRDVRGSAQKVLLAGNATCDCCALGSILISLTLFKNRVKAEEAADVLDYGEIRSGRQDDVTGITKIFSDAQLELIETAYECGGGWYSNEDEEIPRGATQANVEDATDFGSDYAYDRERLEAIMNNIIENKGTFVP